MAYKATISKFGIQSGTTDTLYAAWDWPPSATTSTGSVVKYPKISYTGSSITTGLARAGETDTSLAHRKKIAVLNGYVTKESSWTGTTAQNTKMLTDLKAGKLIKSKNGSTSSSITGTDHYSIQWQYKLNGIWYTSTSGDVKVKNSTCRMENNSYVTKYRFRVKPVSTQKEETKNGKTVKTYLWTADWSEWKEYTPVYRKPVTPSAPNIAQSGEKITASLTGISDVNTTHIRFRLYKFENNSVVETSSDVKVNTGAVSYTFNAGLSPSTKYVVKACGVRVTSTDKTDGDYGPYSSALLTPPKKQGAPDVKLISINETSKVATANVNWELDVNATEYKIQWTFNKSYFDSTSGTLYDYVVTNPNTTSAEVSIDLTKGNTWYFRIIVTNASGTSTPIDEITTITAGIKPSAPTTWSDAVVYSIADQATFNWVHNSVDGSEQTRYEIELFVGEQTFTLSGTIEDSRTIQLSEYPSSNNAISWRVRTCGAYSSDEGWSPWSVQRTINVYQIPSLDISVSDGNQTSVVESGQVESYPLDIALGVTAPGQNSIGFYVDIIALESYSIIDASGVKEVVEGETVYSQFYESDGNEKQIIITAGDAILQNGIRYKLKAYVSLDSGLIAENEIDFETAFSNANAYIPNAEIEINDDFSATIHPYCYDLDGETRVIRCYELRETADSSSYRASKGYTAAISQDGENEVLNVTTNSDRLQLTGVISDENFPECVNVTINCDYENDEEDGVVSTFGTATILISDGNTTETIELDIYNDSSSLCDLSAFELPVTMTITLDGFTEGGTETTSYYSIKFDTGVNPSEQYAENVMLSVYRRDYDGGLTEIARGIDSANPTYVTDLHPALDYARYRIVAIDSVSGTTGFSDVPPIEVGVNNIVIQWDEETNDFFGETTSGDYDVTQLRASSMLVLPYNIKISEENDIDVSLINYIGRKHPVAYYGTQVGQKATWNVEIRKDDVETLYKLRQLAIWQGNVYVREPSGSGYWATVAVSFSKEYDSLTIPVNLTIVRVEGD